MTVLFFFTEPSLWIRKNGPNINIRDERVQL